jgi:hypothetical protein
MRTQRPVQLILPAALLAFVLSVSLWFSATKVSSSDSGSPRLWRSARFCEGAPCGLPSVRWVEAGARELGGRGSIWGCRI